MEKGPTGTCILYNIPLQYLFITLSNKGCSPLARFPLQIFSKLKQYSINVNIVEWQYFFKHCNMRQCTSCAILFFRFYGSLQTNFRGESLPPLHPYIFTSFQLFRPNNREWSCDFFVCHVTCISDKKCFHCSFEKFTFIVLAPHARVKTENVFEKYCKMFPLGIFSMSNFNFEW